MNSIQLHGVNHSVDWLKTNPDFLGTFYQDVVDSSYRRSNGQDYTSVENILKVLNPLFLEDLREELESDDAVELKLLIDRVANIKVFDPASGSGNFLIVAYKELRLIEIEALSKLKEMGEPVSDTQISILSFFGIEVDTLPCLLSKVALWLAEVQMSRLFSDRLEVDFKAPDYKDCINIINANSLRIDWNEVCPNNGTDEIYLVGNPPFGGAGNRSKEQSEDMRLVFKGFKSFKSLDYVASWFWKGAQYIAGTKAKLALVSTNSISQGTQVATIFPPIFDLGIEIEFAYQSFPWRNGAKRNAAVHVVIIGLSDKNSIGKKKLYSVSLARNGIPRWLRMSALI